MLAAATPLILSATSVYFTQSSDTVSFNGNRPGTLTLGNNNCFFIHGSAACTLTAIAAGTPDGAITLSLTMPDLEISPFSYSGEPGFITTSGSPKLDFTLSDTHGDSAQGTFLLTNLLSNGVQGAGGFTGVDIDGSLTFDSITTGAKLASFDSLFGLASSTALSFTLDVGNCRSGSKSVACIAPTDPSAQFISLVISSDPTSKPESTTPEPGTLGLLGAGMAIIILGLRRGRFRNPISSG